MPTRSGQSIQPCAGDRLVVHAHRQGEPPRDAEILEVLHTEHAAYRVRWDDGHESIVYPGPDVTIEHYPRRGRAKTS